VLKRFSRVEKPRFISILIFALIRNYERPQLVEAFKSKFVQEISCGSSHSAAVLSTGELFTWGLGEYGRLGHGDNQTQLRPKQVKTSTGLAICQ